ncbi:MAG: NAD(P)H-dependent oxidoreductase [Flavobacteriaceae bacterium]|nr:NAD(P)H-dependent oxidoreductase [Flavobacteriaceae bacterium]
MKKVMVFGGSNSKTSINKKLAIYAASFLKNTAIEVVDLNNFPLPLFGVDIEEEQGIPMEAYNFNEKLKEVDGFIISLAEHNGSYTVAFKNLLDWVSRINVKVWKDKPMLLLSTSPGVRGGKSVLENAKNRFPYLGAQIISTFSLPSFSDNFNNDKITDEFLNDDLIELVIMFETVL